MAMLDTSHDSSPEALNWIREMPPPTKRTLRRAPTRLTPAYGPRHPAPLLKPFPPNTLWF